MDAPPDNPDASPTSLSRLRAAFARMLGKPDGDDEAQHALPNPDVATPEGIVEAILFVGRTDAQPVPADEIAAVVRDVSPEEVDALVQRLDETYQQEGAACRVERSPGGYRLVPAEGIERIADRLQGRVRAARLSPAAVETLAVVAYRQPIAVEAVDDLRGVQCGRTLAQLVRLGLVRRDAPAEGADGPRYATTDRFLRTLGLADLSQLPRLAELDD